GRTGLSRDRSRRCGRRHRVRSCFCRRRRNPQGSGLWRRARDHGELAKARCKTQIDVGFGDAVTPGPVDSVYPVLLGDMPAPRLRAYPAYTVVAEKLHAIALLGMTNSRVKNYFDLSVLLQRETFDADLLAQAIN